MASIASIIDSFFSFIGSITGFIREMITKITPEWATVIILALSIVGGYYLNKKYPNIRGWMVMVVYSLIIFLLLRFV